jgi:plasmid maintenance system antidote protein VapI
VPPGETIAEIIVCECGVGISERLGITYKEYEMLIDGRLRITKSLAGKISEEIGDGYSPEFWLALEKNYRRRLKRLEK